jgi:hypothetical protein
MEAQWQPSPSPDGYSGPSFRRGDFVAAARRDEPSIRWHLFRVFPDETMERLAAAELLETWNGGESVEFPLAWADESLGKFG